MLNSPIFPIALVCSLIMAAILISLQRVIVQAFRRCACARRRSVFVLLRGNVDGNLSAKRFVPLVTASITVGGPKPPPSSPTPYSQRLRARFNPFGGAMLRCKRAPFWFNVSAQMGAITGHILRGSS